MKYYLDTEFDGFGGTLLSMALVREDGSSLYMVYSEDCADPWVQQNVIPILWSVPDHVQLVLVSHPIEGAERIARFLDGDTPDIITDWPDDIRYFCQAVITGPGQLARPHIPGLRFDMRRVDAYPTTLEGAVQHNAWWDAMALRHLLQPPTPPPQSPA